MLPKLCLIILLCLAGLLLPCVVGAQATASAGATNASIDDLNEYVDPAPPWDHALTRDQWDGLQQLRQQDPNLEARWEPSGVLSRLKGRLGGPVQASTGEAMAFEFLRDRQDLFMQPEPADVFEEASTQTEVDGWTHVRLQQTYKGVPVEGAQIALHFDDGRVPRIVNCNHFVPDLNLSTTALVDRPTAIAGSLADLGVASASGPVTADLVIYDHAGVAHLAWKVRMFVADPLGDFIYFIDARTGGVVDSYNNLKSAKDRDVYDGLTTTTLPAPAAAPPVRTEISGATADASVNAAFDNAGLVYDFFIAAPYSRDGINGAGAKIISTVHYDANLNNAFWTGSQMAYGDGDGVVFSPLALGLDVVAHELVHGITQFTSNLVYQNESGALNESMSDIFAALIDPDWQIGEDVYTPGTGGDALRDLSNPTCCNQPDHYDDLVTPNAAGSALDQACNSATNQDNGCVHYNSGIPNKAAYLFSVGGTFHGITVAPQTNAELGKIWYKAQTTYLMSSDDFADARQATIDAATFYYGGADARVTSVKDAWAAVGVGVPEVSTVPSVLAFGNVEIGAGNTKDADLTLSNPGGVDLIVTNVVSSVPLVFALQTGTSFTVAAGGSATITVRYDPTEAIHGDESANLTITHNAANSPTMVSMTGAGTVQFDAKAVSAGEPAPGGSRTFQLTLTCPAGAGPITIQNVVSTSPFFSSDWTSASNPVPDGGSLVINITYTHSSPGRHTGQLLITHNPTIVVNLAGGAPKTKSVLGFHDGYTTTKTVLGVPFGAEYMTLLLAGIYGVYALRRRAGTS